MADLDNYEKLIPQGKKAGLPKKILFLCFYVLWVALGTVLSVKTGYYAAMLLLTCLTAWGWIWLTWPLAQIEWEYTLAAGTFYVAKIYGKKRRKEVLELEITNALMIAPLTEENQRKAEASGVSSTVSSVSDSSAENVWLMLFETAPDRRTLVLVDMDENMLRILRHSNPRATARDRLTPPKQES